MGLSQSDCTMDVAPLLWARPLWVCADRSPACRWGACQGAACQQHGLFRGDCFSLSLTISPDGQNPVKQRPSGSLQIESGHPV